MIGVKRAFIIGFVAAVVVIAGVELWQRSGSHKEDGHSDARKLAADFTLADLNGQKLRLSDYRGKVVLLDFWATWCEPCKEEIPHFIELQNKYPQKLQIIGISMDDSVEPVRAFQQQYRMNYPVAVGTPQLADQYGGILGLPITFVIDTTGQIVARHIGATRISVIETEVQKLF